MKQNHIHTYWRDRKRKNIYKCAAPDCSHYIEKNFLEGKQSLCNSCGREIVLTPYHLTTARPKCDFCSKHKRARALKEIADNPELQDILMKMENL